MKSPLIFCILLIAVFSLPTELNLPVKADTQEKLSLGLQRLSEELQLFRTPFENKTNLYKRVALVEQYLQELTSQVSQYDNVVQGGHNQIDGSKNIIVGSYNTLKGNDNFVFIEKYTGQANGDLLIGKWRIEIEKKKLILVNSSFAISFINEETNRKYLRYLTESRKFTLGSSGGEGKVTVVRDVEDSLENSYSYGVNDFAQRKLKPQQGTEEQQSSFRTQTPVYGDSNNYPQTPVQSVPSTKQPLYQSNSQVLIANTAAQPVEINSPRQSVLIGSSGDSLSGSQSTFSSRRTSIRDYDFSSSPRPFQSSQPVQSSFSIQPLPNQGLKSVPQFYTSLNAQPTPTVQPTGYTNSIFNSNRLQLGGSFNSNLRSETQTQQSDLKTSLGFRLPRSIQENGLSFLTANSPDRISTTNPSFSEATTINLATWRNRS